MGVFLITVLIIGLAMLVMAVGVLFSNRCLRGFCGGDAALGPDGDSLSCETCPMRKESNA
jgi:hypothetical protein